MRDGGVAVRLKGMFGGSGGGSRGRGDRSRGVGRGEQGGGARGAGRRRLQETQFSARHKGLGRVFTLLFFLE